MCISQKYFYTLSDYVIIIIIIKRAMDWLGLILEIMKWSRLGNGLNSELVNSLILLSILHFAGYMDHNSEGGENNEGQEHLELPLFDLDTLLNATNNFSSDSKLGEGGFGPVYKVRLYFAFWVEDKLQVNKTL